VLASEVVATVGNQVLMRRERRAASASGAPDAATTPDGTPGQPPATGHHGQPDRTGRVSDQQRAEDVPTSPGERRPVTG
jgi:hypothetical protein